MPTVSERKLCRICNQPFGANDRRVTVCDSCGRLMDSGESIDLLIYQAKGIVKKIKKTPFICPPDFLDTEIVQLPDKSAYERAMAWEYGSKGMVFVGPSRAGKSRSLWLLLNRLSNEGVDFIGIDAGIFAEDAAKAYKDGWGPSWRRKMESIPLLAIDDLGNEPRGERGEGALFEVIKNRFDRKLPLIVTTQKVGADFIKTFRDKDRADALVERLREKCLIIPFKKEA